MGLLSDARRRRRTQAILETLARAVLVYGRRNARILYDALGTLAEAVHGALAEPMFLTLIMPPLVQKWQALADTDRELLPLLECFMTLAHQLGARTLHTCVAAL